MARSRKEVNKERDIIPLLNKINDVILDIGYIERNYKGISPVSLRECKKQAYKFKYTAEKYILNGQKTPLEYKKTLRVIKENKQYLTSLFK